MCFAHYTRLHAMDHAAQVSETSSRDMEGIAALCALPFMMRMKYTRALDDRENAMRSCAVWLTVMGLLVTTASTVEAAPKKKRHKADTAAAADSGDTEAAPVEPAKSKSVDDMMDDSTKPSAAPKRAQASEPEEPAPSSEAVGEPDAWERPPAEEPKPKKNLHPEAAEVHHGDGRNINIGLMAGYGVSLGSAPFTSLNPYGFAVGLQGDYELESHMVLGVGGEFFIGNSNDMATNAPGTAAGIVMATYARYILGHALVGYNIWFSDSLYLRPSIWVGAAIALIPPSDTHLNGTVFNFLLAPGLTLHYLMGTNGWYIGGDIRVSVPLGHDGATGMPILATLGKRF